jgi:hypothetical protein
VTSAELRRGAMPPQRTTSARSARWPNGARGYVHRHSLPKPDEAAEKYSHGTVARYMLGKCRCFPCRLATSDAQAVREQAKRPPWYVAHVTARVDVKRQPDVNGNVPCRFCRVVRTAWGITRHENACKSNPNSGVQNGFYVTHRLTGERREPRYATATTARIERDRLNKRDRPKPPTEYVSAAKVRAHLKALQRQGVGVKSIGAVCGVAPSVLDRMARGMIKRTRRATEAKILGCDVTAAARGRAKIDGGPTWVLLDDLIARGFTRGWIARQLGSNTPALQLDRHSVYGDTAKKVRALHERLKGVAPPARTGRWAFTPPPSPPPTPQEQLAARLRTWDADEFSVRLDRFLRDREASL